MLNNLRKTIANIISPVKNSTSLSNQFLKFGNTRMSPDWSQVVMQDEDFYTGYSYAAIRNRSNAVARISTENIKTESSIDDFVHPYLYLITMSTTFSDYSFWSDISTFLDLEGVYYLMAIRNFDGDRVGAVQEFKLLSPYNITRVIDPKTLEVAGYRENRKGLVRDIPKEMIIEIRELNPFDEDKPFAMTDAAKESQFTLRTAGDYTRNALKHNINSPGVMTTDVVLADKDFVNFKKRVTDHTKGEPIFGNGKGVINWQDMQISLDKTALKDINEINRETLFADTGVSKTLMGIEQSGTTRETSKVQVALFISNHIVPRIQLIIDSLNQDYINNYPNKFDSNEAKIIVKNPSKTDHESDLKKTEVLTKKAELYNDLLAKGFDAELSASYVNGDISVEELGEPVSPPPPETPPLPEVNQLNQTERAEEGRGLVLAQEGSLKNGILNIDEQIVAEAIKSVTRKVKNQFEEPTDVISKSKTKELERELEALLIGFYGIVVTFQGSKVMRSRISQFVLPGTFKLDRQTNDYIKHTSEQVAQSHIKTVVNDVWRTANEAALGGAGQNEIVNLLKNKYNETISEVRVKTIARTETNRAFTMAQFDADRQFVKQNSLEGRVFKQWKTRSDDPCPFCLSLEAEGPIPFKSNFRDLGDSVTADGKTLSVNFQPLSAGNAHPNCACIYELIIETQENTLDAKERVLNAKDKKLKKKETELKEAKKEIDQQVSELEKIL